MSVLYSAGLDGCFARWFAFIREHLDEISNTICSVIDAAELCRNVHPDEYGSHSRGGGNEVSIDSD